MLFTSFGFAIFLPIVFALHWSFSRKKKFQNMLLLIASYLFYACWDWRFLFLLAFSTALDYYTGIKISETKNQRKKCWLWLSVVVNLGFLGFFKYYNFFVTSFAEGLSSLGLHANLWTLKVILPVGISFYTFHGLSYVLDLYNQRIEPERNFITYGVFVSFFPLLVAGPIERATHLLPQLKKARTFNHAQAVNGLKQILWGLFKKAVVADRCAIYVNDVFGSNLHSGSTLALAAICFAFQIYGDFSGYSDMALGIARLFGVELVKNFAYPYFSRNIAEFWRKWHISLSIWFKDYLYIPLGGAKGNIWKKLRNVFIVFLVSGFWHGANWTFLAWGLLNAIYMVPSILLNTHRNYLDGIEKEKRLPSLNDCIDMITTFCLTTFAWIFFRSESLESAMWYISNMFSTSLFSVPNPVPRLTICLIIFFLSIEWVGRKHEYAIANFGINQPRVLRWLMYYVLALSVVLFSAGTSQEFIYFQF